MVWLSVIVMGFLLLGRLAQTPLARCFRSAARGLLLDVDELTAERAERALELRRSRSLQVGKEAPDLRREMFFEQPAIAAGRRSEILPPHTSRFGVARRSRDGGMGGPEDARVGRCGKAGRDPGHGKVTSRAAHAPVLERHRSRPDQRPPRDVRNRRELPFGPGSASCLSCAAQRSLGRSWLPW
jgi:hypothetical protein